MVALPQPSRIVKRSAVVVIGVGRRGVGGDDGTRLVKDDVPLGELRLQRPLLSSGEHAGPRM